MPERLYETDSPLVERKPMQPVTIYTTSWCPYCSRAKTLLRQKGVAFDEIDVEAVEGARREMVGRANGRTSVPQIFVGARHVGGCDDLYALEHAGRLDPLLAAA
jgi:glutaredoxin 3